MWTKKLNMESLAISGMRVLIRTDYDVPVRGGKVSDSRKLLASLDSIVYALMKDAQSVVIMSHLGRPRGVKNMRFSLTPVAERLESLLKQAHEDPKSLGKYSQVFKLFSGMTALPTITFLSDCAGSEIEKACESPPKGSIILLENLRFHVEEEGHGVDTSGNKIIASKDSIKLFRQSLRKLGDVYINDAFRLAHTMHSSVLGEGFEKKAAGMKMSKELKFFKRAMCKPAKPFLVILGGINIVDKLHIIDNLLEKASEMIIAGAMAFPFLRKLKNMHTGNSLYDVDGSTLVKQIVKKAKRHRVYIHLPVDFMTGSKLGAVRIETVRSGIEDEWMGLDIGPESCGAFQKVIMRAKTILWSGPPGAYELDHFGTGTESMLLDVVKATSRGATSLLVGEDTAACAAKWSLEDNVSHVSSGSMAGKDLLQGKVLPGVDALSDDSR